MRKSRSKPEKEAKLPETLPAAVICALLSEDDRRLRMMLQKAGIEILGKGFYPVAGTIRAFAAHYKEQASKNNPEVQADIARRTKAEADTAEINLANLRGSLMLRADGKQMWADGMIEMRRALQNLSQFTDRQKREIVEALQSVKLKEPEK